jgi:hypothetical protein
LAAPLKKGLSSTQKNVKAVINGLVSKRLRKDHTFSSATNDFNANEHGSWVSWFQWQMGCRFQNAKSSAKARAEDIGLGRQSDVWVDLLLDEDARFYDVTDACQLLYYHFENLLRMQTDTRLVFYFKLDTKASRLHQIFHKKLFLGIRDEKKSWVTGVTQRVSGTGSTTVTIARDKYLILKATVQHAHAHHDAIAGVINVPRLKKIQQMRGSRCSSIN